MLTAPLRHQLADLIALCDRLPARSCERIGAALVVARRDIAVQELARLLNPAGDRAPMTVARDLAVRLDRFEATGWPRIRDGHRGPISRVESLLIDVLADETCPRSPRRLVDLLD